MGKVERIMGAIMRPPLEETEEETTEEEAKMEKTSPVCWFFCLT